MYLFDNEPSFIITSCGSSVLGNKYELNLGKSSKQGAFSIEDGGSIEISLRAATSSEIDLYKRNSSSSTFSGKEKENKIYVVEVKNMSSQEIVLADKLFGLSRNAENSEIILNLQLKNKEIESNFTIGKDIFVYRIYPVPLNRSRILGNRESNGLIFKKKASEKVIAVLGQISSE